MRKKQSSIDLLFSLSLFMVFVICAFLVLLFQTNGYHQIVEQGEKAGNIYTPLAYIQTQIRSNERLNAIEVFESDEIQGQGLKIKGKESDSDIYIYAYKSELKELRMIRNVEPDFSTGTTICKISSFKLSKEQQVLQIFLIDEYFQREKLSIYLYGG